MSDNVPNSEKLMELMGGDPTKRPKVAEELFNKVLNERKKKKQEEAVKLVEDKLNKACELLDQKKKLQKEFDNADKKCEKEIGKVMNELNSLLERTMGQEEPVTPSES